MQEARYDERGTGSPTLNSVQDEFLKTLQSPRTADTYRWALKAFSNFVEETGYAGYDPEAVHALPY